MTSTSIGDTGDYTINLIISDPLPSSITSSFVVSITNESPVQLSQPPNLSLGHGKSLEILLLPHFTDNDGDVWSISATYSLNGGSEIGIPDGIFSWSAPGTLNVASDTMADVGLYTINLKVSDLKPEWIASSFTLDITNAAPRLVSASPPKF